MAVTLFFSGTHMALWPFWPGRFLLFLVTVHLTALGTGCSVESEAPAFGKTFKRPTVFTVQPWPNFHEGFSGARRIGSSHRCWPWASLQNNPCNWKRLGILLSYFNTDLHGSLNSSNSFETSLLPTAWSMSCDVLHFDEMPLRSSQKGP